MSDHEWILLAILIGLGFMVLFETAYKVLYAGFKLWRRKRALKGGKEES